MNAFIISVRHTGTRFLSQVLGCDFQHVDWMWGDLDDRILVSPLRDPKSVWKSWCVRGQEFPGISLEKVFVDSWRMLAGLDLAVTFVPIDRPEGEAQMQILSDKLQKPIRYDFSDRVGHSTYTRWKDFGRSWLPEFDFIYELPMIKQFYTGQN